MFWLDVHSTLILFQIQLFRIQRGMINYFKALLTNNKNINLLERTFQAIQVNNFKSPSIGTVVLESFFELGSSWFQSEEFYRF